MHIHKVIRGWLGCLPDVVSSAVVGWDMLTVPTDPSGIPIKEEGEFTKCPPSFGSRILLSGSRCCYQLSLILWSI